MQRNEEDCLGLVAVGDKIMLINYLHIQLVCERSFLRCCCATGRPIVFFLFALVENIVYIHYAQYKIISTGFHTVQ